MVHQESKQEKWDQRFARQHQLPPVAVVLERNVHLLPAKGRALEIACGLGANSLLLAAHGLHVDAWDISAVALEKLSQRAEEQSLHIQTRHTDVEASFICPPNHYDLIIVGRFLYRALCQPLINTLKPGGLLFYQTFTANNKHRHSCSNDSAHTHSPCNDAYKLQVNELLQLFAPLELVYYREEGLIDNAFTEGSTDSNLTNLTNLTNQACYIGRKPAAEQ
jgi:tellurite methyltransferase